MSVLQSNIAKFTLFILLVLGNWNAFGGQNSDEVSADENASGTWTSAWDQIVLHSRMIEVLAGLEFQPEGAIDADTSNAELFKVSIAGLLVEQFTDMVDTSCSLPFTPDLLLGSPQFVPDLSSPPRWLLDSILDDVRTELQSCMINVPVSGIAASDDHIPLYLPSDDFDQLLGANQEIDVELPEANFADNLFGADAELPEADFTDNFSGADAGGYPPPQWFDALIQATRDEIDTINRGALNELLEAGDATKIEEQLQELRDQENLLAFLEYSRRLLANLKYSAIVGEALAGCWSGWGDNFRLTYVNGILGAEDSRGSQWTGRLGGGSVTFTLLFRDLEHYVAHVYGTSLDNLSEQEAARIHVLVDAGVLHEITLALPVALAEAQVLNGVFLETPVAEPLGDGQFNTAFAAVAPSDAVFGTVFTNDDLWTRFPACSH